MMIDRSIDPNAIPVTPETPAVSHDETHGVSHPQAGWRLGRNAPSLPEVFSSVPVPQRAGFWRTFLAYAGPGLMVAVGYMDPGNWATDLAGGAQFGYLL